MAQYLGDLGAEIDIWDVDPGDPNVAGARRGAAGAAHRSLVFSGRIDVAAVERAEAWESRYGAEINC